MRGCSTITGKAEMYGWILHHIPQSKRILDVGFGWGAIGRYLRQYYYRRLDGLDIWPEDIELNCLERIYQNIHIGDMRDFENYADYDAVIYGDSLEHIPLTDAVKLLERVREEVDYIIVSVPYNNAHTSNTKNPNDKHEQGTIDREYMNKYYPYLTCIFDGSMHDYDDEVVGVYVWSRY